MTGKEMKAHYDELDAEDEDPTETYNTEASSYIGGDYAGGDYALGSGDSQMPNQYPQLGNDARYGDGFHDGRGYLGEPVDNQMPQLDARYHENPTVPAYNTREEAYFSSQRSMTPVQLFPSHAQAFGESTADSSAVDPIIIAGYWIDHQSRKIWRVEASGQQRTADKIPEFGYDAYNYCTNPNFSPQTTSSGIERNRILVEYKSQGVTEKTLVNTIRNFKKDGLVNETNTVRKRKKPGKK